MKIAYLANIRFPSERAHATQIAHMCQAFSQNGHEVDLYVNKRESADDLQKYYGFKNEFTLIKIFGGIFLPKIKISFYINELIFAKIFYFFHARKKYDLLYSRSEFILFFLSLFVSAKKIVWESHEAKLNWFVRNLIFKKKIKVVVISEGIYDFYINAGVNPKNTIVAHDGIDESFFADDNESKVQARMRLGIPAHEKVVMYIGGFDAWKGVETFFEASESIPSDIKLYVIGGQSEAVEKVKQRWKKVTFLGPRPYKELQHNQQAADILVIPNTAKTDLSAKYTSPLKLFAHMSSGVPLLVSKLPSLQIVLGPFANTCTPDDPKDLARQVEMMMKNYAACTEDALKVRAVAKKYTWDTRAHKVITFVSKS